jgi:hypothetical protein
MAEYEKIKRITIPLEHNHLLLITTQVEADHGRIIDIIRLQTILFIATILLKIK